MYHWPTDAKFWVGLWGPNRVPNYPSNFTPRQNLKFCQQKISIFSRVSLANWCQIHVMERSSSMSADGWCVQWPQHWIGLDKLPQFDPSYVWIHQLDLKLKKIDRKLLRKLLRSWAVWPGRSCVFVGITRHTFWRFKPLWIGTLLCFVKPVMSQLNCERKQLWNMYNP